MKKRFLVLWVSLLCVCGIVLSACGGAGGGGNTAAPDPEPVDPAEKFIATWKLAGMETKGMTVVGDLSAFLGEEMESEDGTVMAFDVQEGGKGVATFMGEEANFTWELADDNTITVTPEKDADDADDSDDATEEDSPLETTSIDFAYAEDMLTAEWSTDEDTYHMTLTKDGVMPGAPEADLSKAAAITSLDQIEGTWKLSAVNMLGALMYGDAATLAELTGNEGDSRDIVVNADGSATFFGEAVTCSVGDDGASIDVEGESVSIVKLGDYLVVDMSGLLGADFAFYFGK